MRFNQILNEAADYSAMISPVLSAIVRFSPRGIAHDLNAEIKENIQRAWDNAIEEAKPLKKADRITWYLRLVKAGLVEAYSKALDPAKANKLRQDYNSRSGTPIISDSFNIAKAIPTLLHYLSLPIAGIQDYQFRFQSYATVIADFQQMEDKWKASVKDTLQDDDSKIIINCGDNWFWVNTEKAYCSKEAAAMGHCGNEPRRDSGDHLLSLRKKKMFGKEVRWEPHLTFILNDQGILTEMKGKGNEKPVAKYFPMIVQLLRSTIVKGIVGGGYLPENNFSIDDLDDATREELIKEKPELGTVADLYTKYGPSNIVFDRLTVNLKTMGLSVEDWSGDTITLETWNTVDALFRTTNDREGRQLTNLADGEFDDWLDMTNDEKILTAIFEKDEDGAEQIATRIGVDVDKVIPALLHMFPKSIAAIWGEIKNEIQEDAKKAIRQRITGMPLSCHTISITIEDDGGIAATMPFEDLVLDTASYMMEDYEEIDSGFEYCAQSSDWLNIDVHNSYASDSDEVVETDRSLYDKADQLAIEHLLGLFHDED